MTSQALVRMDQPTMLQRMEKARFLKSLSKEDKAVIAAAAIDYGYDPVMKEITLYEGNLYITAIGHMNRAARHAEYAGLEVRPMTPAEREQYQMQDAPYAYIAKCYRKGYAVPSVGTGTADPQNPYRKNPIEREHPEWMAESRAVRRAIRPYFPPKNPFAPLEEQDTITVDTETGEVIEGEARVITEAGAATVPADLFPDPDLPEPDAQEETAADPEAETRVARRKEIQDLYTARKWPWDEFLAKFTKSYQVEFDDASLVQLDDALDKIKAALRKNGQKGAAAA